MLRVLPALFLFALDVGGAAAQNPVIIGPGAVPCAEIAKGYQRNPGLAETQYFAWAQGYMSAINLPMHLRNERTRNLDGMPIAAQKQHLRSFCDQRPLANFEIAVRSLYERLPENPIRSN